MPPIRRSRNLDPAKGARPRVAGTSGSARAVREQNAEPKATPTQSQASAGTENLAAAAAARAADTVDAKPERDTGLKATGPSATGKSPTGKSPTGKSATTRQRSANQTRLSLEKNAAPAGPPHVKPRSVGQSAAGVNADGSSSRGPFTRPVIAMLAAAAVLVAFAVLAAFEPWAQVSDVALVDGTRSAAVQSAARNTIETIYSIDYNDVDTGIEAARPLLTGEMLDELNTTAETTKSAIIAQQTLAHAEVGQNGVSRLDGDFAQVSAFVTVHTTNAGIPSPDAYYRMLISLTRQDGNWLVSDLQIQ